MELSIIIVNYRGWARLKDCLDCLSEYSATRFTFEVIVADNRSDDGMLKDFPGKYPEFRFIENPVNGGFAYGCNRGAGSASGTWLLFLNPDTVAAEDEIGLMLEGAKKYNGEALYSCRQTDAGGSESQAFNIFPAPGRMTGTGRAVYNLLRGRKKSQLTVSGMKALSVDWISGSVVLMKRTTFDRLGGFDERFWMYYEDVDLCKRARENGAEVLFFIDPVVRHIHGGSSRINIATAATTKTEVLISRHVYVSKHYRGFTGLFTQVSLITGNLLSAAISAAAGLLLFYIPQMQVRVLIFINIISYYLKAARKKSWISERAVYRNPV